MGNEYVVDAYQRLNERIDQDTDDILCTIQLVHANEQLVDRLFEQLVDLLVERLFLDLRERLAERSMSRVEYVQALADLAADCRRAGLLPLPSSDGR